MPLQAKADQSQALGIYVHVPFCATTCDFCAFYQEAPDRAGIQLYLKTVGEEFQARRPLRSVETVFWGGGTPGLLTAGDLAKLGQSLLKTLPNVPKEWSIELAPSTVKPDKVAVLKELGVTRISLGVQSFDDHLLERLGRQHSEKVVRRAIDTLREGGIENLNLDLIFAVPGQSVGEWRRDLAETIAIAPAHISTYCLTFEEDTKLWARLQRGEVHRRSESEEAQFYETTWEVLESAGYPQYEISNFAQAGRACLHNINTWRMQEWLGYGPSASSQYEGQRFTAPASLKEWTAQVRSGERTWEDSITLTPTLLATDALIFGLRMNTGIAAHALHERFPGAPWAAFERLSHELQEEGLLEIGAGQWRLTPTGRLLADRIGVEFLEAAEG